MKLAAPPSCLPPRAPGRGQGGQPGSDFPNTLELIELRSLLCPPISVDSVKMPKQGSLRDRLQLGAQRITLGLLVQFTISLALQLP